MILSRRVALNGVQLDGIDNRILIQGIRPSAGKEQISAVSIYGGTGQRVTGQHRDTLDVSVIFSMRIRKTDLAARSELFEKVCGWAASAANGGWLTLNYKQNRRLRVRCAQLPDEGDLREWTNRYTIVFRAYSVPYWQQITPETLTVTGASSATQTFTVPGTTQSVLGLEFLNTSSSTCDTFSITAGSSTFSLTDLGLAAGETLVVDHTADGILRIRIHGSSWRSVMAKRTAESSDDLYVNPGEISVSMTAQRAGTLTISCAGRFAG